MKLAELYRCVCHGSGKRELDGLHDMCLRVAEVEVWGALCFCICIRTGFLFSFSRHVMLLPWPHGVNNERHFQILNRAISNVRYFTRELSDILQESWMPATQLHIHLMFPKISTQLTSLISLHMCAILGIMLSWCRPLKPMTHTSNGVSQT